MRKIGWHAENLKMKDFHKFLLFHVRYLRKTKIHVCILYLKENAYVANGKCEQ